MNGKRRAIMADSAPLFFHAGKSVISRLALTKCRL